MTALGEANVYIVLGLQFGDEGKGATVDYLTRRCGPGLVVRFNGGAQAAHNVVVPRRLPYPESLDWPPTVHHTFSSFGSGTLAGSDTHLTRHVLVDPPAMLREAEVLRANHGIVAMERITIAADACLVTPLHKAVNRLRELSRKKTGAHGTCGMGIGEARTEADHGLGLQARYMGDRDHVRRWYRYHRERMRQEYDQIGTVDGSLEIACAQAELLSKAAEEAFIEACRKVAWHDVGRPPRVRRGEVVIFEGAQGVLLDETHGFHPHTTWSDCTYTNAYDALPELLPGLSGANPARVCRVGVMRSYITRHGAGPLPTHAPGVEFEGEHNGFGAWQGAFRVGMPDLALLRHAVQIVGGVDALAVTHCDHIQAFTHRARSYKISAGRIPPRTAADLALAVPNYEDMPTNPHHHIADLVAAASASEVLHAWGPTAQDWQPWRVA